MDFLKGAMERIKPDVERLIRRELGKMMETNANASASIHVLADERLGGIKREYVEVDRKAGVGEKIVIVDKNDPDDEYENGDILTVDREFNTVSEHVESDEARSVDNIHGVILREEYRVLEPTDIVHIDGQRYEMADRKAKVGEKVMYVDESGESYGIVTEVIAAGAGVVDVAEYEEPSGAVVVGMSHDRYRVLVPVEADEPQPADLIDVVSNLATRVADLERENKKLHAALDEDMKIRSENTRRYLALQDEIDTLHKDNRTLGEELERLKQDGEKPRPDADMMAEAFAALARAGLC